MSSKNLNNDLDQLETQVAIYFSELLKTNDEIEELASSFNRMRIGLKDRNDLLESLLKAFEGKFGKVATIVMSRDVSALARKNPRILGILPKKLVNSIRKQRRFVQKMKE